MKKLIWLLLLCSAFAQNTVTVTAANIQNGSSGLLSAGTILFQAVNSSGQNISYQIGATGPNLTSPTICPVTSGAIVGSCIIANVALASPQNFCFAVTIKNSSNVVVLGGPGSPYQCVQPVAYSSWCSNSVCDFDNYYPTIPNAVLVLYLPPPGAATLGGIYASTCPTGYAVSGYNSVGVAQCVTASGGSAVWGQITGALANQTDLASALALLAPLISPAFTGTPTVPTPGIHDNSSKAANTQWVQAQGYSGCSTVVCPNQNNTYGINTSQTFPVSSGTSSLVLGTTFFNPCCSLAAGSTWLLNNSLNSNPHITYFDGQYYQVALTNLDNAGNLTNGTTGTGAIALANSPIFTTPNIGNAVGTSLTLQLTTGDQMDLQAGLVTPYIQAVPAAGHIKTGYGSDNRFQASNNGGAFSDFALFSDNLTAVYGHSGTQAVAAHITMDVGTFSGGTLGVSFSGAGAFTSSTSYFCSANDTTAANPIKIAYTSGTAVTFTGTSTDSFRYVCVGT